MSKPDNRVVGQLEVRTGPFITISDFNYCGGLEDGIYQLVPESLLAEAESAANNLHTNLIAAYAARDALQARLDGVVALADVWEAEASQMEDDPDIFACLPHAVHQCATELRAALGGESPANDEESK